MRKSVVVMIFASLISVSNARADAASSSVGVTNMHCAARQSGEVLVFFASNNADRALRCDVVCRYRSPRSFHEDEAHGDIPPHVKNYEWYSHRISGGKIIKILKATYKCEKP
ncbi:hypothetical protein [Burkholderia diffusa]|uniref:hypothetical protein n=1 Tax=Burkholderia diffusa TaxID=488732 RepID=UPI002ABDA32B|nr:hypothetical protein [Burkholderia diffusa]